MQRKTNGGNRIDIQGRQSSARSPLPPEPRANVQFGTRSGMGVFTCEHPEDNKGHEVVMLLRISKSTSSQKRTRDGQEIGRRLQGAARYVVHINRTRSPFRSVSHSSSCNLWMKMHNDPETHRRSCPAHDMEIKIQTGIQKTLMFRLIQSERYF